MSRWTWPWIISSVSFTQLSSSHLPSCQQLGDITGQSHTDITGCLTLTSQNISHWLFFFFHLSVDWYSDEIRIIGALISDKSTTDPSSVMSTLLRGGWPSHTSLPSESASTILVKPDSLLLFLYYFQASVILPLFLVRHISLPLPPRRKNSVSVA